MKQPQLHFWQMWNVSFGFLGIQIGFALQSANITRILADLGAHLESLSLFFLVAPLTGLIVQPFVGAATDRTWNRMGRRNPYIFYGAFFACIGMLLLPNASVFVAILSPMIFGVFMLALMDVSFNVTMQPFRALVSDMVPAEQRDRGYAIQTLLINIGAIFGSLLPFLLTNVVGLDNTAVLGQVSPSTTWAFYVGATVMMGSVWWTVFRTKEYPPEQYYAFKGMDAKAVEKEHEVAKSIPLKDKISGFLRLLSDMPQIMRQLAVVQFFSWFPLFIMWTYMPTAMMQYAWGIDIQWFDPDYVESVGGFTDEVANARGTAGDWNGLLSAVMFVSAASFAAILGPLMQKFGRKPVYATGLLMGGVGFASFILFNDTTVVEVNVLVTTLALPKAALWLIVPMIGIGFAWASLLAVPYAMLAGALPANKTGVYMGIFNFTVATPQIVAGIVIGPMLANVFDNHAIYMMLMAGGSMTLAALSVSLVKSSNDDEAELSRQIEDEVVKT